MTEKTPPPAIMYVHPRLYDLSVRLLHGGLKEYRMTASMVLGPKVLDLACGTCILRDFLPNDMEYEGWDLNESFLRDSRGRGITTFKKNAFDLRDGTGKWDTIVVKDVLHHVYPDELELLRLALGRATNVVVSEPVRDRRRLKDVLFGPKAFRPLHRLVGDFDAVNPVDSPIGFAKKYGVKSFMEAMEGLGEITARDRHKDTIILRMRQKHQ